MGLLEDIEARAAQLIQEIDALRKAARENIGNPAELRRINAELRPLLAKMTRLRDKMLNFDPTKAELVTPENYTLRLDPKDLN